MVTTITDDGMIVIGKPPQVAAIVDPQPDREYFEDGSYIPRESFKEQIKDGAFMAAGGFGAGFLLMCFSLFYGVITVVDVIAAPLRKDPRKTFLLKVDKLFSSFNEDTSKYW